MNFRKTDKSHAQRETRTPEHALSIRRSFRILFQGQFLHLHDFTVCQRRRDVYPFTKIWQIQRNDVKILRGTSHIGPRVHSQMQFGLQGSQTRKHTHRQRGLFAHNRFWFQQNDRKQVYH